MFDNSKFILSKSSIYSFQTDEVIIAFVDANYEFLIVKI